ncbi:MAG: sigma 54-interacting transcriptional regulator [Planctomycetaceae bacterium]|nr:sigma 54-interacting transcriptional regulator [Planctomycetaceae bacterium]
MPPRTHSMNFESLQAIATLVAQQRNVNSVLELIVESLVDSSDLALARIWLTKPGDICAECPMLTECPDRTRCLHHVATAARPQNPESGTEWYRTDGFYRRFPLGVRRIGVIAATGNSLKLSQAADDPEWFARGNWLRREGVVSFSGHPLKFRDETLGVLAVFSRSETSDQEFAWLRVFADSAAVAIANATAFEEIESLKKRLEQENEYLREEVQQASVFGDLIGQAPALQAVTRQIELVAPTNAAVLILGESGTGKEVVAREIHRHSLRADRPLIKVNCAAIPRELYESEFFGHAKGAFTGALRDRAGRFELADGGTLFLDEIGEIPLDLQAKLLRVLQEGEIERIGEEHTRKIDVRIIAATNRNLRAESEAGRFRQDLFYRLSVFPMELPPLRKRVEDIPLLAGEFLNRFARQLGRPRLRLTLGNVQELQRYDWPGNIRELQHALERACIVSTDSRLRFDFLSAASKPPAKASETPGHTRILTDEEIRSLEANNIRTALAQCNGKVYGLDGAASLLGVKPTTLNSRIKSLGIKQT